MTSPSYYALRLVHYDIVLIYGMNGHFGQMVALSEKPLFLYDCWGTGSSAPHDLVKSLESSSIKAEGDKLDWPFFTALYGNVFKIPYIDVSKSTFVLDLAGHFVTPIFCLLCAVS